VDAVVVEDEAFEGFLQAVDVDERDHEDGVGAVGELEDACVGGVVRLR
jgi:hypothetical protein